MTDTSPRYRQAARERFDTWDNSIFVPEDAPVRIDNDRQGAWVHAQLFVDCLEPEAGPTYDVWIAERSRDDLAPGGHFPGAWAWAHAGATFTCDDDPDGKGARVQQRMSTPATCGRRTPARSLLSGRRVSRRYQFINPANDDFFSVRHH
jgi:hypothetical protein